MSVLTVKPLTMKEVDLLIGSGTPDDFAAHCSSVTFTPSGSVVTWNGLKRNSFTDATVPTWTCGLDYAQDWESANSLSRYLFEHEGEHLPVTFKPTSEAGPTFTGVVIVTPGAIGGAVNAVATASVTLGMESRPTLVPAS
jgi:hypothetical protein